MDRMNSEELFVLAMRMLSPHSVICEDASGAFVVFANNPHYPCKKSHISRTFANIMLS